MLKVSLIFKMNPNDARPKTEPIGNRPIVRSCQTRMLRRFLPSLPTRFLLPKPNLPRTITRSFAMSSDSPETREVCDASELEDGKMSVPFLPFAIPRCSLEIGR
jgi:hypothetical protein